MKKYLVSNRGQLLPITAFILFAAVVFLLAVVDAYRITKAKLQVQNLADATALAVASLEAQAINTVVDRDEWMNHMYAAGAAGNKNQVPNISDADVRGPHPFPGPAQDSYAQTYAQLIMTVNLEQNMYITAYNNFLGAGNQTSSQSAGLGSLGDILSEIQGLTAPGVLYYVWNAANGESSADSSVQQMMRQGPAGVAKNGVSPLQTPLTSLAFQTYDVVVKGKKDKKTLQAWSGSQGKVGWMAPDWKGSPQIQVKTSVHSQASPQLGAGACVIKAVQLILLPATFVKAKSVAYIVQSAGISLGQGTNGTDPNPPEHFRPTYFVQLGVAK